MKLRGAFEWDGKLIPNLIPNEGEEAYLKMIFQGDDSVVAEGGDFYIGLCANVGTETTTLATISEISNAGGYSRKAVARSNVGWTNPVLVDGTYMIQSASVDFTASGAAFDPFWRFFLTNVASGTAGKLLAISGPLPSVGGIPDGQTRPTKYTIFLD